MSSELPPALVTLLGAAAAAFLPARIGRWVLPLIAPLALAWCWFLISHDAVLQISWLNTTLTPVRAHAATPAFATIFCLMLFCGTLFAAKAPRAELAAAFVYASGALGVAFAGDWISLLAFWELMMLGSTAIIWLGGSRAGRAAGLRYFGLHALGGVVMLFGIVMVVAARTQAGDADALSVGPLTGLLAAGGIAQVGAVLVLLAMLLNAGAPPLSAWLGDAYPQASPTGSVFLSAFTTKTAVFALLVTFAGLEALIWIGLCMALYGIIYAVLENDVRRVLAYSIVNQVGFMLVGIGVGTPLALDGAAAHAFAHIIYKALLFMCAGWVIMATGKRLLSDMGGLWRSMPLTLVCCMAGALAISAFPMTSGFTTKSLIGDALAQHASALAAEGKDHGRMIVAWVLLLVASAGVFLHAGIKLPWYIFFARPAKPGPRMDPPGGLAAPMVLLALLCVLPGIAPGPLYAILPTGAAAEMHAGPSHTLSHTIMMLALLGTSGAGFFVMLPVLKRRKTITLDWDWFWRRLPRELWYEIGAPMVGPLLGLWSRLRARMRVMSSAKVKAGPTWLIGGGVSATALIMLMALAGYLLLFQLEWWQS